MGHYFDLAAADPYPKMDCSPMVVGVNAFQPALVYPSTHFETSSRMKVPHASCLHWTTSPVLGFCITTNSGGIFAHDARDTVSNSSARAAGVFLFIVSAPKSGMA